MAKSKAGVDKRLSFKRFNLRRNDLVVFIVIFAIIGGITLVATHAAAPNVSIEPEKSTVISPAVSCGTDSSASNSGCVQFKKVAAGNGHTAAYNKLGLFPGPAPHSTDQLFHLNELTTWLGRSTSPVVPYLVEMTDGRSPGIMAGNGWGMVVDTLQSDGINYPVKNLTMLSPKPMVVLSIPLAFMYDGCEQAVTATDTTGFAHCGTPPCDFGTTNTHCFDKAVAGQFDSQYRSLLQYFINGGYQNNLIIRLGWEFDGNWMPWSAQNNYSQYKAAYRHVHDLIRGMSGLSAVKFDWCTDPLLYGTTAAEKSAWDQAYPGAGYVDIVGMDAYNNDSFAWSAYPPFLQLQEDYAKSIGATVSFPEWGLAAADSPTYIQNMYSWFNSLPASGSGSLEYQSYFMSSENGATALFNVYTNQPNQPNAAAKYKQLFSN